MVRQEDLALRVNGYDRSRAAFDKDLELIFRVATEFNLGLQRLHMLQYHATVLQKLGNKEACAHESNRAQHEPENGFIFRQVAEGFLEHGTDEARANDLSSREHSPQDDDGEKIEESQRDIGLRQPVRQRNGGGSDGGNRQQLGAVCPLKNRQKILHFAVHIASLQKISQSL